MNRLYNMYNQDLDVKIDTVLKSKASWSKYSLLNVYFRFKKATHLLLSNCNNTIYLIIDGQFKWYFGKYYFPMFLTTFLHFFFCRYQNISIMSTSV